MKNAIQNGNVLEYVVGNAETVTSGNPVFKGGLVGIAATTSSTEGDKVAVNLKGVFSLPKDTPLEIVQGDLLFWSGTEVTKTATDKPLGTAFEAAGSAATTVLVLLPENGIAPSSQAAVIAAIATADGSDAATTQALANSTKAKVNAILVALKNAGIMASA